jgi:hypothetical protein
LIRAVIDTNVLVAGLRNHLGNEARVIGAVRRRVEMSPVRKKPLWLMMRSGAFLSIWLFLWAFCILELAMTWGAWAVIILLEYLGYHPMTGAHMG